MQRAQCNSVHRLRYTDIASLVYRRVELFAELAGVHRQCHERGAFSTVKAFTAAVLAPLEQPPIVIGKCTVYVPVKIL